MSATKRWRLVDQVELVSEARRWNATLHWLLSFASLESGRSSPLINSTIEQRRESNLRNSCGPSGANPREYGERLTRSK